MDFISKIQAIESLLPKQSKIRDRRILATGVYYKIRLGVSFRDIPVEGTGYSWSNFRYWMQYFRRRGLIPTLESIVEGW